ncbi:class I SAM-dependent methyltransferase [Kitasatospora sp. RB6PN24]|uniref:class I SAM-dependent methyltransferase n=1 Tax=Kitasatospora humi TaxID=2893891 RepID=UPI001E5518A6|nr:class I SAM-dependent methyltransferase [Kitasatospora humi]MCC9310062.1 class I SAM-dependent methyltransferase [Kitasatospora humi]
MTRTDPPPVLDDAVLAFYNEGREQDRLADPRRSIEYLRTMDVLERHLPPAPARILDIGGGPGRYALALASAGYAVTLLDPVPLHVRQAADASASAEHPLTATGVADARALPAPDESFDAVLLLGPLYHLPEPEDRHRAWTEAARVLHPGGVAVAAGASRYYTPWEMIAAGKLDLPGALDAAVGHLRTGRHANPGGDPRLWTTAYFHDPHELAAEAAAAGLGVRALLPVEGPAKLVAGIGEMLQDARRREEILHLLRLLEDRPDVLGTSEHVLAVATAARGRRP